MKPNYKPHIRLLERSRKFLWDGGDKADWTQRNPGCVCSALRIALMEYKLTPRIVLAEEEIKDLIKSKLHRTKYYSEFLHRKKITKLDAPDAEIQCQRYMLIQELIDHYTELQNAL